MWHLEFSFELNEELSGEFQAEWDVIRFRFLDDYSGCRVENKLQRSKDGSRECVTNVKTLVAWTRVVAVGLVRSG